jgi:hypothetical protein
MYPITKMVKNNTTEWKIKTSEFNGYVKSKLENLEEDIKFIRKDIECINKKFDIFQKDYSILKAKVYGTSALLSIIIVIVLKLIFKM